VKKTLVAVLLATVSMGVMAEGKSMTLFKVVSTRDDVTIGFVQEMDLERLGNQLTKEGYIRAWQYATARGEKGDLVQKPVREAVIMGAQVIRIEIAEPGQTVVAPPAH
jgi:hypothetical protein